MQNYNDFVNKFKPKKTTDDCYTPPEIYEVIKKWACEKWDIDPQRVVRPFWPGADYTSVDYQPGQVVIDNPPFSVLSKIINFYIDKNIPFFLFAPSLTMLGRNAWDKTSHIVTDAQIIYHNGAKVKTSFITSFDADITLQTAPDLTRLINAEARKLREKQVMTLPKYEYPGNVITTAMAQKFAKYGIALRIYRDDCVHIRQLDSQKASKKEIYGAGLLLSKKAAAEKAAAEKWTLSEREWEIITQLGVAKEKNIKE